MILLRLKLTRALAVLLPLFLILHDDHLIIGRRVALDLRLSTTDAAFRYGKLRLPTVSQAHLIWQPRLVARLRLSEAAAPSDRPAHFFSNAVRLTPIH